MPSLRATAFAFAGLLMGSASGSAEAQVRIGLSAPLTGPDAAFGQGLRLGAEQAVATGAAPETRATASAGAMARREIELVSMGGPFMGVSTGVSATE